MKAISRPTHGVIDYVVAGTLVGLPYLLRSSSKVRRVFHGLAAGHAAYSLLTRYETGVIKRIPFRTHMVLDAVFAGAWVAAGVLMKSEPAEIRKTMAAIGVGEAVAMALTAPNSKTQKEAFLA